MRLAILALVAAAPELRRIIVLGRHGNRAPNPPILHLCPTFAKEVLPGFGAPVRALSPVGVAQCWESGRWLRARYVDGKGDGAPAAGFLPAHYSADGTVK